MAEDDRCSKVDICSLRRTFKPHAFPAYFRPQPVWLQALVASAKRHL